MTFKFYVLQKYSKKISPGSLKLLTQISQSLLATLRQMCIFARGQPMPSHHLPEEVLIAARGSWQRVLDKLNRNFKEGCPFQRTKRQIFFQNLQTT
jgi:hypothetical protein